MPPIRPSTGYAAVRAHLVREGRVLLGLSQKRSLWTTFGGKIEPGETPEVALHRELREELGILPTRLRRLADRTVDWDGAAAAIAVYAVTAWRGSERNLADHEHERIAWFTAGQLVPLAMTEAARGEALGLLTSTEIQVRAVRDADRDWVSARTTDWWASPIVVSRGRVHRPADLEGFIARIDGVPVGLVTLLADGDACEVVTLNSMLERQGVGSALLAAAERYAIAHGCRRLWLVTTNDNADALRFYEHRGMRVGAVHVGAVDEIRMLKPEIPLTGHGGVPIRDEIELTKVLGERPSQDSSRESAAS